MADGLTVGFSGALFAFGLGAWVLCCKKADAIEAEIAAAQSWPRLQGTITQSKLIPIRTTAGVYPSVQYQFQAAGQTHKSNRMLFGGFTGTRAEAEAFVAQRPVGAMVEVYCNPANPKTAVLVPSGDGKTWRQNGLWIGVAFAISGFVILLTGGG